jgi:GNAT superfamily N-acetyltransferase
MLNLSTPAAKPVANPPPSLLRFKDLIAAEYDWFDRARSSAPAGTEALAKPRGASAVEPSVARPGLAGEPWVDFTSRDCFGLALSGGGIRSATFNLGLLQGLHQKQLLEHVDYLSTVSGGGYVGGSWTAWRHRHGLDEKGLFPDESSPPAGAANRVGDIREAPPFRHLREFSRFLMPRLGLFRMDVWQAVVTILGGLLPSILAACAVLALSLYTWFFLFKKLIRAEPFDGAFLLFGLTLLVQLWEEKRTQRAGKSGAAGRGSGTFLVLALVASLLVGVLWWWCRDGDVPAWPWLASVHEWLRPPAAFARSAWPLAVKGAQFDVARFIPAIVWGAASILLLVARGALSRFTPAGKSVRWPAILDRVVARCLQSALVWSAFALLWQVCRWAGDDWQGKAVATGGAAGGAAAVFALMRDWLAKPVLETNGSQLTGKVVAKLKAFAPQLLAIAIVILMMASVCLVIQKVGLGKNLWWGFGVVALQILLTLLLFNPARLGLHDFYRARISRCYLGAAGAALDDFSRISDERLNDDVTLGQLKADEASPCRRAIHLVCCAANDLAGDPLTNLYRGARSAVLSPFGISLGNHSAPLDHLRLSSALTASAAAFNSQMGRLSMDLGPAVAFVMSALNLRLGLWVPHPLNPHRRPFFFTGLPFFYEMFGLTNCDPGERPEDEADVGGDPSANKPTAAADASATAPKDLGVRVKQGLKSAMGKAGDKAAQAEDYVRSSLRDLHLSDGGHFENLALYELVRRHCRYIIVSDCGADPQVAFDDLAIALRSIREDFGIEIDLDVTALRPGENGRARQHAVVGTVHYDGLAGLDKGTILYFKPALTGDEPPDVLQYHTRNPAFPHESTGDQFYDEAQWESYRRLGQHAAAVVLRLVDRLGASSHDSVRFVENVFLSANRLWHPGPERQSETFLALTQRFTDLETDIRDNAPAFLRAEFFPEAAAVLNATPQGEPAADEQIRALYFLMVVAQLMEDTWIGAELDIYWSHPLNDGWMNYFQRWASTPSFRRWWPVLRPIYSLNFRDFVRDRFDLSYHDPHQPESRGARFELRARSTFGGLASEQWSRRQPEARTAVSDRQMLEFLLSLDAVNPPRPMPPFQAGVVFYKKGETDGGRRFAEWRNQDLFVPHALIGAGIIARLLNEVLDHLQQDGVDEFRVVFDQARARPDPASRWNLLHEINFYKSRGFVAESPVGTGGEMRLVHRVQTRPGQLNPGSAN